MFCCEFVVKLDHNYQPGINFYYGSQPHANTFMPVMGEGENLKTQLQGSNASAKL
jgi:hypothetical protein